MPPRPTATGISPMSATGTTVSVSVCPPMRRSACFAGPRAFPFPIGEPNRGTPAASETRTNGLRKAVAGLFLGL